MSQLSLKLAPCLCIPHVQIEPAVLSGNFKKFALWQIGFLFLFPKQDSVMSIYSVHTELGTDMLVCRG